MNMLLEKSKKMRKNDAVMSNSIDNLINERKGDATEFEIATLKEFKMKGKTQPFKIDGEKLALLKESMDTLGQITPIAIRENSKGKLEVFSGLSRLKAAKELGWTTIKGVNFGVLSDKETFTMLKNANIQRDKPFPSEIANLVEMSKNGSSDDEKELTVSDIARMFSVSRKHVYRCYKMLDLTDNLHEPIDKEFISTSMIEKIAANLNAEQQEVLGQYIAKQDEDKAKKINAKRLNILLDNSEEEFTIDKITFWFSPDYKPAEQDEDEGEEEDSTKKSKDDFLAELVQSVDELKAYSTEELKDYIYNLVLADIDKTDTDDTDDEPF